MLRIAGHFDWPSHARRCCLERGEVLRLVPEPARREYCVALLCRRKEARIACIQNDLAFALEAVMHTQGVEHCRRGSDNEMGGIEAVAHPSAVLVVAARSIGLLHR